MNDIRISTNGVHKFLNTNLKSPKATSPDSIPSLILKATASKLDSILTELYRTSLNTGDVQQDWR